MARSVTLTSWSIWRLFITPPWLIPGLNWPMTPAIGAYSIIKGTVRIGAGTVVHEHSHIHGTTLIGEKCEIGPAAYVGLPPQHLHADREIGQLVIGDHVTIRETATVHRAIHGGIENATRVGDHCFIMGGCACRARLRAGRFGDTGQRCPAWRTYQHR